MGRICLLFLLLFGLSLPAAADRKDYQLSPGDVVKITVYDHPDLATEARLNESGGTSFPLLGEIKLGGGTVQQAEANIARSLEQGGFIKHAQVNLIVLQFRGQQVNVLGQVNRPGRYPIEQASSLTDILALAGGVGGGGADQIVLIRRNGGKDERHVIDTLEMFLDGKLAKNTEVTGGDVIYVPRYPQIYIYGEVQRPGAFRLERNMSVVQALSVGGGLTQRGTQRGIRVMRRGQGGQTQTLEVALSDLLKPDDVITSRKLVLEREATVNFTQLLLILKARYRIVCSLLVTVSTTLIVSLLLPKLYRHHLGRGFQGCRSGERPMQPAQLMPGYIARKPKSSKAIMWRSKSWRRSLAQASGARTVCRGDGEGNIQTGWRIHAAHWKYSPHANRR